MNLFSVCGWWINVLCCLRVMSCVLLRLLFVVLKKGLFVVCCLFYLRKCGRWCRGRVLNCLRVWKLLILKWCVVSMLFWWWNFVRVRGWLSCRLRCNLKIVWCLVLWCWCLVRWMDWCLVWCILLLVWCVWCCNLLRWCLVVYWLVWCFLCWCLSRCLFMVMWLLILILMCRNLLILLFSW